MSDPWYATAPTKSTPKIKQFRSKADPYNSETIDSLGPWVFPAAAIREGLYSSSAGDPAVSWKYQPTDRVYDNGRRVWLCAFYDSGGRCICVRNGLRLVGRFAPYRVYFKCVKSN